MIEQCPHSSWFSINITLGHSEIIGTKNTLPWTSKGFGQYLDRNNARFRSYFSFPENIFEIRVVWYQSLVKHHPIYFPYFRICWYMIQFMKLRKISLESSPRFHCEFGMIQCLSDQSDDMILHRLSIVIGRRNSRGRWNIFSMIYITIIVE